MSDCSEQQRVACALGGIYTALAINKVLPVLHCGPGCQQQAGAVLGRTNGGQNTYPFQETILPCTDFCESEVIFGGSKKLRKLIEKSIDYINSEMLIVVDGCTSEIVGDDIEEVAKSFYEQDMPILYAKLPGFKGNNLYGHSQILNAIITQYLKPASKINSKQVNVWGIVPYYDPMWQGTLEEIEKLLKIIGLEPNIIYGRNKGLKEVNRIPEAEFNLLLSPWVDLDIVQELEKRFNTPFLHYPNVPIGPSEISKFIRTVADYANLSRDVVEKYIKEEEDRYYYYISRHIAWIYGCKFLPKEFFVISSASAALAITKYFVNDLGLIPKKIYIVDDVPKEHQELVRNFFDELELEKRDFDITFTDDGGLAADEIENGKEVYRAVVFGSEWDIAFAKRNKFAFLPISAPYGDVLIGTKNYFGYEGALKLFADYYTELSNCGFRV
ncbi:MULTISPECIES: nitrogenase component 1 [unclassified Clostridium]|uniref:nitrogenase component 1 n=1 Tax=unclassified Clostridium TaxID=2614128 RepID=UPI000297E498|nr:MULTISPECIES: nitrogenase component 1 [unclassified Clostridium]EKQ55510.1 MAG: nitrogenase molybdenum-iron protein, alpha and beta chain [Clostridium sp. Maddingley MBC34-26]